MVTSQPRPAGKKPYEKPNLRLYGDIRTITGSVPMAGPVNDAKTAGLKSL